MGSLITKIHGRYYDVGKFEHPGGCPAIECARDRDATELFESYHALHRERPVQALESFEISADAACAEHRFLAEKKYGPAPFDWQETLASPFRRDLLAAAQRYFRDERNRRQLPSLRAAMKAPPRRWLEMGLLGVLFFASLIPFVQGSWIALFVMPFLGWLFVVNFWHDALHFGLSRSGRINQLAPYLFPWFMSPTMWLHQHVIGHHAFTNDPERDPDVHAAPRLLRQSPKSEWRTLHARQRFPLRVMLLYSFITLTRNTVRDHLMRHAGWVNDSVPLVFSSPARRAVHIIGRLIVAASLFVWPFFLFPFGKALAFAIIPSMILSEMFGLFSQVNHMTTPNVDAAQTPSTNWYVSQVRASCSYATDSYAAFILSGGLNLQIEHHLLPGVNHYHLFQLSPEIKRICAEHGVHYHSYPSFRAALRAHFEEMQRLAVRPDAPAAAGAEAAGV